MGCDVAGREASSAELASGYARGVTVKWWGMLTGAIGAGESGER